MIKVGSGVSEMLMELLIKVAAVSAITIYDSDIPLNTVQHTHPLITGNGITTAGQL